MTLKTSTQQMIQFTGTEESAREVEAFITSRMWARNEYEGLKPLTYTPPVTTWKRLNTDTFVHNALNHVFPSRVRNSETFAQYKARQKSAQTAYDDWFLGQTAVEIVTLKGTVHMTTGKWLVFNEDNTFSILREVHSCAAEEPDLNDPVELGKAIDALYAKLEIYLDLQDGLKEPVDA